MDKKSRTCCFTGHRTFRPGEREQVRAELERIIRQLVEQEQVLYFGAGGALGFDTLAAQTVLELKASYPQIKLILVLPCQDQEKFWSLEDVQTYRYILSQADKVVYTAERYYDGCMQKRNRHLVDAAAWCVCYQNKPSGGTAYTVEYARRQGLQIRNCTPQ